MGSPGPSVLWNLTQWFRVPGLLKRRGGLTLAKYHIYSIMKLTTIHYQVAMARASNSNFEPQKYISSLPLSSHPNFLPAMGVEPPSLWVRQGVWNRRRKEGEEV
jgi:hypothetical protein